MIKFVLFLLIFAKNSVYSVEESNDKSNPPTDVYEEINNQSKPLNTQALYEYFTNEIDSYFQSLSDKESKELLNKYNKYILSYVNNDKVKNSLSDKTVEFEENKEYYEDLVNKEFNQFSLPILTPIIENLLENSTSAHWYPLILTLLHKIAEHKFDTPNSKLSISIPNNTDELDEVYSKIDVQNQEVDDEGRDLIDMYNNILDNYPDIARYVKENPDGTVSLEHLKELVRKYMQYYKSREGISLSDFDEIEIETRRILLGVILPNGDLDFEKMAPSPKPLTEEEIAEKKRLQEKLNQEKIKELIRKMDHLNEYYFYKLDNNSEPVKYFSSDINKLIPFSTSSFYKFPITISLLIFSTLLL
uniref:Uncharacterized protein n=1 Tax=Theileria annulata TaxID=5874 RepID=A0A3B0MQK4_THEAN